MMKHNQTLRKSKTFLRLGAGLLMAIALPVLASCTHHRGYTVTSVSPLDNLHSAGVQVIHSGETYHLVISSDQLFHFRSTELTHEGEDILDNVADFLNAHHIITVKVAAYSDSVGAGAHKNAFTQRQATAVQSYLSDNDLQARLIYADGQGAHYPVAWNGTWVGRHANRRVEISFMVIPRKTIYE